MLRVFICWSGPRSKEVAIALREWLAAVFQQSEVFMSDRSIEGGERWTKVLQQALESTVVGLCILNSANRQNQWIAFEAGSLAKTSAGRVIPILCGISDGDLQGSPLAQFQAKALTKAGLEELAVELNRQLDRPVERLETTLNAFWPTLGQPILDTDARLADVPAIEKKTTLDDVLVRIDRLEASLPGLIAQSAETREKIHTLFEKSWRDVKFRSQRERLGEKAELLNQNVREILDRLEPTSKFEIKIRNEPEDS